MDRINYPIVLVIWIDAMSSDEWADIDTERKCPPIFTVGYLISDDDVGLTVAQNIDQDNGQCSMTLTIPNHWVESIQELKI